MTTLRNILSNILPRSSAKQMTNRVIVPLKQEDQVPVSRVGQLAVSILTARGAMPLSNLVEGVASQLYRDELRRGAQILDIGLFGSRLFEADVISEIEAGNGGLWRIEELTKG
jgi:hypothetical protein